MSCELRALGTVTTNWRVLNGFALRVAKRRASLPTHMAHPKGSVSSEEIYGVPYLSGLAGPLGNDGRQALGVRFITGARNYRCAGRNTRN